MFWWRVDPEMCMKCLVVLVSVRLEIICCAELHVTSETCVKMYVYKQKQKSKAVTRSVQTQSII